MSNILLEPAAGPATTVRQIGQADAGTCGRIIYQAFAAIADRHHFPRDFPGEQLASELAGALVADPRVFGVVAQRDGRIVGSNFLFGHDKIRGVGPITVDPSAQGQGVGRALMQAVLERGRGAAGIRLVQDAFNTASMALYASLGFDAREPLALLRGTPLDAAPADAEVRPMREADLPQCAELCRRIHGIERSGELRLAMMRFQPLVLVARGRLAAYMSAPTFWLMNHGVAETEHDMRALLLGAGARNDEPLSLLLPIRQAGLLRWCLSQGLRIVKPMTLMTMGRYQEPRGCFYPSVLY